MTDIDAARAELAGRGMDVSEVFHFGPAGQTPGPDPQRASYNSFLSFSDPDGNGWLVQEVKAGEARTDGVAVRQAGRRRGGGDGAAFDELAGLHRRELHVHCYRMLGVVRRRRGRGAGGAAAGLARPGRAGHGREYRAWLYRIATNVCLDVLRQRSRQAARSRAYAEVPWLQPYPDRLLNEVPAELTARGGRSSGGRPSSWRSWPRSRCCRHGSAPR